MTTQKDLSKKLVPQTIQLKEQDGTVRAAARVQPGLGANLVSFESDGVEFIYWNESDLIANNTFSGAFNMFPTPCRLAGCAYEFEGKTIRQKKHGEDIFLHGLIRDEFMESRNEGQCITSRLEIAPGHPVFEGFPFKCVFTMRHALDQTDGSDSGMENKNIRLTVGFKVENRDTRNIPCGYGIHPYWTVHGRREDIMIRIPGDYIMDMENLVPTGTLSRTAGTEFDLRTPVCLAGLDLDNIFWKRAPEDSAEIIFGSISKKIVIEASEEFTHMIAYTPPEFPFFCVENLTTSPNAPNLVSKGMGEAANMLVIPPGKTVEGWVRYSVVNNS